MPICKISLTEFKNQIYIYIYIDIYVYISFDIHYAEVGIF